MGDDAFFSGWIVRHEGQNLVLKVDADSEVEISESFMIEAFGAHVRAVFTARLEGFAPDDWQTKRVEFDPYADEIEVKPQPIGEFKFVELILETRMTVFPTSHSGRILAGGITAKIKTGCSSMPALLLDYNTTGFGIESSQPFEPGAMLSVEIDTLIGAIAADGVVVYCSEMCQDSGKFRVGLRIKVSGRIDKVRWHMLTSNEQPDNMVA